MDRNERAAPPDMHDRGHSMSGHKIRNMEEFAAVSGLSRPTVSKYFNDPASVRPRTRERIEAALAQLPDIGLDPLTPGELPGLEHAIAPQGWLRTRPDTGFSGVDAPGALDGFFAARLVRKA